MSISGQTHEFIVETMFIQWGRADILKICHYKKNILASIFQASVLLLTANFITFSKQSVDPLGYYFIDPQGPATLTMLWQNSWSNYNRTDALKTEVNLLNHTLSLTQCIKTWKYWSHTCISPYSMPLCTIFTKCPAPSPPT